MIDWPGLPCYPFGLRSTERCFGLAPLVWAPLSFQPPGGGKGREVGMAMVGDRPGTGVSPSPA
ncbi:MAG: hypothetical protein ACT4PY_08310, partial [Armatimonadota bacterium]